MAAARRSLSLAVATLLASLLLSGTAVRSACLDVGFYDTTCPSAETIVQETVAAAFTNNSGVAPALIRMHFHDCFVRGCDGSVLIDTVGNRTAEKDAAPNKPSLRFFDVVDRAKLALEAQCPGVVSCADILAFAARDSVVLSGGLGYDVPGGRRDGRISLAADALNDLPAPFFNATQLADRFASKHLTVEDLVVLSGAHTIGVSHCSSFAGFGNPADRIDNFSGSPDGVDPALSEPYASLLRLFCPPGQDFFTTSMDLITPEKFDNKYYVGLTNNLALFTSDAALLTNATMKALVDSFARSENEATWKSKFARSMLKMGQIGVLSGTQGEIRLNCRVINPDLNATAIHHSASSGVAAS